MGTDTNGVAYVDADARASVRAALIDFKPDAEVSCNNGVVLVRTTVHLTKEDAVVEEIKRIAETIPGVDEVRVGAHSAYVDV